MKVSAVRVYTQTRIPAFEHIDAVQLVGTVCENSSLQYVPRWPPPYPLVPPPPFPNTPTSQEAFQWASLGQGGSAVLVLLLSVVAFVGVLTCVICYAIIICHRVRSRRRRISTIVSAAPLEMASSPASSPFSVRAALVLCASLPFMMTYSRPSHASLMSLLMPR